MAFADFPEQQQIVEVLQRSLERSRLAHGYLFVGSQISELEAMARALVKTLNCESPKRGANNAPIDSCDTCSVCRRIDGENHPDVLWVRPESKLRVIRLNQLIERHDSRGKPLLEAVYLKPTEANYKAGILVGADRLNEQAANAFLKTLEEPPPRSILILLTTEPQRVLETIISRCLRLNFVGEKKLNPDEMAWLTSFAEMAANPKAGLLGRYRLLGVLVQKLGEMKEGIEEKLGSESALEKYDEMESRLRDKLEEELSAAVESEYRRQRSDLLLGLQLWLRDVWLRTVTVADDMLNLNDLAPATNAVAQRISTNDALRNLQVIEETQRLLATNIQEALALEVGFLRLKL